MEEIAHHARISFGHFTTLQIRNSGILGWEYHLSRLQHATHVLFGCRLDCCQLTATIASAYRATQLKDADVKISIFPSISLQPQSALDVLLHFTPHAVTTSHSMRLLTMCHQRALPHIKHTGIFSSFACRQHAEKQGFDDALFTTPQGFITEGTFWNIGFLDQQKVVWPRGPMLCGTQQRLLYDGLHLLGITQDYEWITLEKARSFSGAFVCNARGQRPIAQINHHIYENPFLSDSLAQALALHSAHSL